MSNEFLNVASDLLSGALSANVSIGRAIDNAAIPRMEPRTEMTPPRDERMDRLLLVCTAMWQLLKEKTDLTEEDLINRVAILDAQDGTADGTITEKPRPCPKCQRIVNAKQARCLYCGFQLPLDNVFRTI